MGVKASYLIVAHVQPGRCTACRHANQGTADFAENHLFCSVDGNVKQFSQQCNIPVELRRAPGGPLSRYFFFDRFTGDNGRWGVPGDTRVIAEDATYEQREEMGAMRPVIEADKVTLYAGLVDGHILALGDDLKVLSQVVVDTRPVDAVYADEFGVVVVTLGGKVKLLKADLRAVREVDLSGPLVGAVRALVDGKRAVVVGAASAALIGLDETTLAQVAYQSFAPNTMVGLVAVSRERLVVATWQAYVTGVSFSGLEPQHYLPSGMDARPKALFKAGAFLVAPSSLGTLLVYRINQPLTAPRAECFASGRVWLAAAMPSGDALVITENGALWRYDVGRDIRTPLGTVFARASAMAATDQRVFVSNDAGEIAAHTLQQPAQRVALTNLRTKLAVLSVTTQYPRE